MDNNGTPSPEALRQRPAPGLVLFGAAWAAIGGLVSMHTSGGVRLAVFLLAAWVPVLALIASMRGTSAKHHWVRMAWGVIAFVTAASLEAVLRFRGWSTPSEENPSDLIYLAGYALLASGIWTLIRRHGRSEIRKGLIDGAVMLVPPVVLLIEYVAHVPTNGDGANWALRLLAAGYPLLDLILLAALVWLVATPTLTRAHLGLLATGMGLSLIADMALAVELQSPSDSMRRVIEGLYPLTWTLLAAGIATGAAVRFGRPRGAEVLHWGRIGLLGFGALLGPLVIVIAAMPPEPLPVIWVATSVVLVSFIIVWRMMQLARTLGTTTSQLDRARQELQVQATHDPLTGLLNRAVLDDVLDELHNPASLPGALLSIDLDLFKSVNDTHGHDAGDTVLRITADRLRTTLRPADLVLRMGGDEFLAVLHEVTPAEAQGLARRIVAAIQEPIRWKDSHLRVSASAGVASIEADSPGQAPELLMTMADAAMYEAKRADTGSSGAVAHAGDGADLTGPQGATVTGHDDQERAGPGEVDTNR